MPDTGVGPFYPSALAGVGTNNKALKSTLPVLSGAATVAFGTDTANNYILVKPGVGANATPRQALTATQAGQNFGWNFLVADFDATASLPSSRLIPAGTWTFGCVLVSSLADAVNAQYTARVYIYKRTAAGALTQQGNGAEATLAIISVTETAFTISAASDVYKRQCKHGPCTER